MEKVLVVLFLIFVVVVSGCTGTNTSKNIDTNVTGKNIKCSGLNESQCESNKECRSVLDHVCGVAGDCHYLYGGCESVELPVTDCMPFNPLDDPCEMLSPGSYVSSVTGKCEYNEGNACSQMPFETLKECQSVCGIN